MEDGLVIETDAVVEEDLMDISADAVEDDSGLEPIRELVLKAHPDVVPELVQGETVEELLDSVEPARRAFSRIADELAEKEQQRSSRTSVPAGGVHGSFVDMDALPPSEMLRRGVARRA